MKFAPCKVHAANAEMAAGLSCMRIRHDDGRAASAAEIWAEIERLLALVTEYSNRITSELTPEIERLRAENDTLREAKTENEALRERMAELLTGVAVALRGPEPPLTRWSWHDLPERAAAAVAAIDVMQRAAAMAAGGERHNV